MSHVVRILINSRPRLRTVLAAVDENNHQRGSETGRRAGDHRFHPGGRNHRRGSGSLEDASACTCAPVGGTTDEETGKKGVAVRRRRIGSHRNGCRPSRTAPTCRKRRPAEKYSRTALGASGARNERAAGVKRMDALSDRAHKAEGHEGGFSNPEIITLLLCWHHRDE